MTRASQVFISSTAFRMNGLPQEPWFLIRLLCSKRGFKEAILAPLLFKLNKVVCIGSYMCEWCACVCACVCARVYVRVCVCSGALTQLSWLVQQVHLSAETAIYWAFPPSFSSSFSFPSTVPLFLSPLLLFFFSLLPFPPLLSTLPSPPCPTSGLWLVNNPHQRFFLFLILPIIKYSGGYPLVLFLIILITLILA